MDEELYAFESEHEMEEVLQGARWLAGFRSLFPIIAGSGQFFEKGSDNVSVQITGSKDPSGLYPAKISYPDLDVSPPGRKTDSPPFSVWAAGPNNEELTENRVYKGDLVGVGSGNRPVVEVTVGGAPPYGSDVGSGCKLNTIPFVEQQVCGAKFKVVDTLTLDCSSGKIVVKNTYDVTMTDVTYGPGRTVTFTGCNLSIGVSPAPPCPPPPPAGP